MFQFRHINRRHFPRKYVLVVEDDLENQVRFATWATARFEGQGDVQFDFVTSAISAALILHQLNPHLIILDHDLPYGNASDLLAWMANNGKKDIPIITASGIPHNNQHMVKVCEEYGLEVYHFQKPQVFFGDADHVVRQLLLKDKPLIGRKSDGKNEVQEAQT